MARPTPLVDCWPLLPRPTDGKPRAEDEPVQGAFTACVGLAALFLVLRQVPSTGLGPEMARLVALVGGGGGFALTSVIVALLLGVAVVAPVLRVPEWMRTAALSTFDHALHLAYVLSVCGVFGALMLQGKVTPVTMWFTGQAAMLWGLHRTRLWLAGPSAA